MPQEVVRLQISIAGDDKALSALQSLDQLAERLNKTPIKLNIDTSSLSTMEKQVSSSLNQVTKNINAQARLLEAKNQEANINAKLEQSANQRATAEAKVAAEAEKTRQAIEKTAQAQAKVQEAQAKAETVEQRRRLLAEQMAAAQDKANMSAQKAAQASSQGAEAASKQAQAVGDVAGSYEKAEASAKDLLEIQRKIGENTGDRLDPSNISTSSMEDYIKNVQKMENATVAATKSVKAGGETFQQFSVSVKNAAGDYDNYTISVGKATGSVYKLDNGLSSVDKTAGKLGQTLGDEIVKFVEWAAIAALVYAPLQAIGDAVEELKAVDAELVNIQKVMGATAGEMETLSDKAYEVGSALGVAASDYLASVNKWAQAGYGSLSDELGELSVRTQKVGDVQEETANQFLLSVDAAYQYKGNIEALTRVLDGANEISNNYATSVEKLAGGMGIVSSLAAQAGMEVQETMAAIGTITAVTQESGNSAARALRALILNIQGSTEIAVDEATGERWTEDEIEATAAALGDLNIATREYKDGIETLRNPMEVIGELSDKYRKGLISEVQLQDIVSSLGGKVRSNQLQALISNYDMYEEMLQTYEDAAGSADEELDIYLNSWEAKTNRLKNQWVELVASFQADDLSKGLLDVANALMEIANTPVGNILVVASAMAALNTAFAGFKASKEGEAVVKKLKDIGSAIKGIPAAIKSGGVIGALKGLGSAFTTALGPVGLAITAIYAVSTALDWLVGSGERAAEKISTLSDEYESGVSTLESLKEQLDDVNEKIAELNGQDTLSFSDEEDLKRLQQESEELERQIRLQEILNEKKKEELSSTAEDALNAGFDLENEPGVFNALSAFWNWGMSKLPIIGGNFDDSVADEWWNNFDLALAGITGDASDQVDAVINKLKELREEQEKVIQKNGDDFSVWPEGALKYYDELEEEINSTTQTAIDFYNQLQTNISHLTDEDEAAKWKSVADALYAAITPAQDLADRIQGIVDAMDSATQTEFLNMLESIQSDGTVTASEVQSLIDKFPALNSALADGAYSLSDLVAYFDESSNASDDMAASLGNTSDEMSSIEDEAKTLADTLNELESSFNALQNAQDELNGTGELSLATVGSLIERFPEMTDLLYGYLAGITTEQELQEGLREQYDKTAASYRQHILEKMYNNEEFYKNTVLTNTDIVKQLNELGIADLENYKTLSELKEAISADTSAEIIKDTNEMVNENADAYNTDVQNFLNAQRAKTQAMAGAVSSMLLSTNGFSDAVNSLGADGTLDFMDATDLLIQYPELKEAMMENGLNANDVAEILSNVSSESKTVNSLLQKIDSIISETIALPSFDSSSDNSSSTSAASTSWYEQQIEALQNLISTARDTNTILEREDQNSAQKRIENLRAVQSKILDMQQQFRARGLSETSDELQQLKLMYYDVADEIESAYQSMYDALMESHSDREWNLDLYEKQREAADRTLDEITADNAKILEEYRSMQEEVKALSDYYRTQGYDDTDDLIQDLTDAWWDYEAEIESIYDSLSNAFEDYAETVDRNIEAIERSTDSAGIKILAYTQRIKEAQKTIAALMATNTGGINNDRIWNIQEQIYADQDAIKDIQNGLLDELYDAVDKEFDKWQDKIDEAQNQLDHFNELVSELDKQLQETTEPLQEQIHKWQNELEDKVEPLEDSIESLTEEMEEVLKPIEDKLDDLNDRLEAEQEALENLVDPLEKQIEGYYTVNPEGTIGEYIPGINDRLDDLNEQLDEENRKWDEQQKKEDEALSLQRKELALQEAIKKLEQAQLDLETARNERTVYTLKDGVWAWRPDDQAIQEAEDALEDAEQAKEDAEQELEDLKEQQAHDKIVGLLEDQIEALEKQKEQIEAQIDIYEKESEARQEYLQDQIDLWEKEQEAKEDYYNDLIDANEKEIEAWEEYYNDLIERNEDEIEAWEDYYEAKKEQYDDDIAFWENEVKELQAKYDEWMEEWEGIQESLQEPTRSIAEILNDIATYGTPAMKEQVDNIVDLLDKLGTSLEGFDPNGGVTTGNGSIISEADRQAIMEMMLENGRRWGAATTEEERQFWHEQNLFLGSLIGANYDPGTGKWDIFYPDEYPSGGWASSGNENQSTGTSGGTTNTGSSSKPSGGNSSSNTSSGSSSNYDPSDYAGMTQLQAGMKVDQLKSQARNASDSEKRDLFEQANAIAVAQGANSIPYSSNVSDWKWYGDDGTYMFDRGGIAHGKGLMVKGVEAPEVVLSPVLAADVLNPVSNEQFDRFARDLGIMFGAAQNYTPDTRMERNTVINNQTTDSHNTYINGVEIGESMMDRPLSEVLSLLGIHRNY